MSRGCWRPLAAVAILAGTGGCDLVFDVLRPDGPYLPSVYDVLTPPGRDVELRVKLESGPLLHDVADTGVRFHRDGVPYAEVVTNAEGEASVPFSPREPGDTVFTVHVDRRGLAHRPPPPVDLLVACRQPDEPMLAVDLDWTLVESFFEGLLQGDHQPMPGSREALARLAEHYTIVYLTFRVDRFAFRTKRWFRKFDYPRGPLLMPRPKEMVQGSSDYKAGQVRRLREDFPKLQFAVEDRVKDARKLAETGITVYLMIRKVDLDSAEACRELAAQLAQLPEATQVVETWDQVRRGILEGERFPLPEARQRLLDRASRLEANEDPLFEVGL